MKWRVCGEMGKIPGPQNMHLHEKVRTRRIYIESEPQYGGRHVEFLRKSIN